MKAEEARKYLLDWINYVNDPNRVAFIDEPCSSEEILDAMRIGAEALSQPSLPSDPIPITPEILKKNGFYWGNTASEEDFCGAVGCSYPESGWCFDDGAGEIKIIFPNESDGGLIRLDDQSDNRHLELVFANPIMVHELQHCLKLCGIEIEIVLHE